MQSLFSSLRGSGAGRSFAKLKHLQKGVQQNLEKVMAFNLKAQQPIFTTGPLLKLLYSFNVNREQEGHRYRDIISDNAYEYCTGVGISNSINVGQVFENDIFGENIFTVYIGHPQHHELDSLGNYKDWRTASPLKVLYSPISDVNFDMPTGMTSSGAGGIAVLSVDVTLLALQWREWAFENEKRPAGERRSREQYLHDYVFNNMLKSQADIAMFNRLVNLSYGKTIERSLRRPVVPIIDYHEKLNKQQGNMLKYFDTIDLSIGDLVDGLSVTVDNSLRDILPRVDTFRSRQIEWALLLANLPFLEFIVAYTLQSNSRVNTQWLRMLKKELRLLRNEKSYLAAPERYIAEFIKTKIEALYILL